jgi:hypothetical protein
LNFPGLIVGNRSGLLFPPTLQKRFLFYIYLLNPGHDPGKHYNEPGNTIDYPGEELP